MLIIAVGEMALFYDRDKIENIMQPLKAMSPNNC